jgi:hypothetical protein
MMTVAYPTRSRYPGDGLPRLVKALTFVQKVSEIARNRKVRSIQCASSMSAHSGGHDGCDRRSSGLSMPAIPKHRVSDL